MLPQTASWLIPCRSPLPGEEVDLRQALLDWLKQSSQRRSERCSCLPMPVAVCLVALTQESGTVNNDMLFECYNPYDLNDDNFC